VSHGFILTHYFWVNFDLSIIFGGSWKSIEDGLDREIEPPSGILVCQKSVKHSTGPSFLLF